jgi:hypothetical protein
VAVPAPEPVAPPAATGRQTDVDDCALIASPGEPVATVALPDPVDPAHAPRPTNDSERLLFRQLYETLVRADCLGRLKPGLAAAWRRHADGRSWIVTLREHARFADGTPVTASDVRTGWMRDVQGDTLRSDVQRLVHSIAALDDRTLAIELRRSDTDAPTALAHPDLAIAKPIADSAWPLGTRSSHVVLASQSRATPPSELVVNRDGLHAVRFLLASSDHRDFLDAGVDLLLTREPAALDYARISPQYQMVPLAWQRTHVLLTPDGSHPSLLPTDQHRQELAADAIRGEARGARAPFWWQTFECHFSPSSSPSSTSPVPRLVYDATDGVARELAGRLVGVGTYERAAALSGGALAQTVRLGSDAAYLVAVDTQPLDPCRDLQTLMISAPWITAEAIAPLVETRLQAIVRRGRSGISAEWDGAVLIDAVSSPKPQ